jgi:cellulose biosynthesis protein BcsQ
MAQSQFDELVAGFDRLLAEARRRLAAVETPPETPPGAPEMGTASGLPGWGEQARLQLQTLTAWSTKGGDGKTFAVQELAYVLANFGGRRTLLVDADMNRGYLELVLSSEVFAHARTRNLKTMATLFEGNGQIPPLAEFVFNYPSPFAGKGAPGKLDILLGISSLAQADLACFSGEQAERFLGALVESARAAGYEFVLFDIGTLLLHAFHQAVIRYAGKVLIIASPMRGSLEGTRRGLEDLLGYNLISRDKLGLVLNRWDRGVGMDQDEIFQHMGLTMLAAVPAVDIVLMQRVSNLQMMNIEAFIADPKEFDALGPLVKQFINLAEFFVQGIRAQAVGASAPLAQLINGSRRGIFGKKEGKA